MAQIKLTFRDPSAQVLLTTDIAALGTTRVALDGNIAARVARVDVHVSETPDSAGLFGSPEALAQYRQQQFRQLAEDQFRRGLTMWGAWDDSVPRCGEASPEGGACSLRAGHGHPLPEDQHERAADPRHPREIAEIWPVEKKENCG